jgi:hypothetical protein
MFAWRQRQTGPVFDALFDVVFTPDGTQYAYRALAGDAMRVVSGTRQGRAYRDVSPPVFSPDGAHVAYIARDSEGSRLVVDGRESEPFDRLATVIRFSADSRRVAFGIQRHRRCHRLVRVLPLVAAGAATDGGGR